jgi:hypothetical protein
MFESGTTYPPDHPFVRTWTVLLVLCWIHVLFIVPFKTGFLPLDYNWLFFTIDLASDLILFSQLFIAPHISKYIGGELVLEYDELNRHYMRSEFYLDLFCGIPIDTIVEMYGHFFASNDAVMMELYVTLARVPKMLLFYRLSEMINKRKINKYINHSFKRVSAQALLLCMLLHWVACGWIHVTNAFGFGSTEFVMPKEWESATLLEKYGYAVFWGLSKMTSSETGTGSPSTQLERNFAMLVSLAGIAAYASLMGSLANWVLSVSAEPDRIQAKIQTIHNFLRKRKLPKDLSEKISKHMEFTLYHEDDQEEKEIYEELPNRLRADIVMWRHKSLIASVPLFKTCSDKSIHELIVKLKRTVFAPNESIFQVGDIGESMYFINKGQVEVTSATGQIITRLSTGSFFGESALQEHKRSVSVHSVTFCDMMELTKENVIKVAEDDENLKQSLKQTSIKEPVEPEQDTTSQPVKAPNVPVLRNRSRGKAVFNNPMSS